MRPMNPRPIFTLSTFTAATKTHHFASFSNQATNRQNYGRWQEEESRGVRVSVWWDFENCHVPVNANAFRVAQCITNAIRANGIKGPIEITAFGDVMQVSRTNQEALSATGINLTHVPSGGKNSADRSLLVDLMYWVSKNPPPAHLFLISGDRDFAGILHRLRMSNYNILLASPDSAPNVLCSAATIMWHWSSLLKGENLTGKVFNQPPDGPYNSWYGYCKANIEDPFAVLEQSSCSSADESSLLAPEPKPRPIPKAVRRHISQILGSYPEGISISQLRNELFKSNNLDKELYGYKKFTRFLLAMPQILKLHGDAGNIFVQRVNTKSLDEAAYEEPGTNNSQPEFSSDSEIFCKKSSCENIVEKSKVGPIPDHKVKAELSNLQETPKEGKPSNSFLSMKMQDVKTEARAANIQDLKDEENRRVPLPKRNVQDTQEKYMQLKLKNQTLKDEVTHPVVQKNEVAPPVVENNENKTPVPDDHSSGFGFGTFRRIWVKLFGRRYAKSDEASLSGKDVVTQEDLTPCQSSEPAHAALFSPSSHEALINGKTAQSVDPVSGISSHDSSFSNQSLSWFKFWKPSKLDDKVGKYGETVDCHKIDAKQLDENKVEKNGETVDCQKVDAKQLDENEVEKNFEAAHVEVKPKRLEIFEKESFWKEMQSFINSSQSSALFSKSRTREHVAQNLQKQGPPVLRSLSDSDLLHLVDLLISDKKWVEVRDSRRYPFRLTISAAKCPENYSPSSSNGLSQIFSTGKCPERNLNHPHTGVLHRDSSSKPRVELLTDCQKLVDLIVKEYPEGFNIGGFRKLFLEKYGYALDLQKIGHEKLVNFLKTVPGAMVESNLILPAGALKNLDLQNTVHPFQGSEAGPVVDLHGDSSIISKEDDESDSWDELGPVDTSGSEKDEMFTRVAGKSGMETEHRLPYYEPLREDDFSDSEEETYASSDNECKPKASEESALLNILDSWHSQKAGDSKRDESMGKANVMDSVESGSEFSSTPSSRTKTESEVVKTTRKQKANKSYSFVKDQPVDSRDKLLDGILGNLKKPSDNSADSKLLS